MPPKRPLEETPPCASSSDEESEEEEEGSEEEQQQEAPKSIQSSTKLPPPTKSNPPKPPSSDDDEVDDEDEEEDLEEEKANPAAVDEEEDDFESESGSESDNEPVKHMIAPRNAPVADVKPISSKPMSDVHKSKKPTSINTVHSKSESKPAAKRPLEEENEKKDKKRKKKKVSDIEDGGDEENQKKGEEKKQPFQRVWAEEDEIILLSSLIDFKKEGHNAATDMGGFHDFVKDSLHIDVTRAKLLNKIQRLEKKFKNNASRGKDGKDPVISKPHELKSYVLSKEIWGDQSGKDNGAETNNVASESGITERKRRRTQVKSNGVASPKRKVAKPAVKTPKIEYIKEEAEEEDNANEGEDIVGGAQYPYLSYSMQFLNHPMLPGPPQGLAGLFAKKGWDLIGTSKAEAFDQKWKALLITETKAYLERIDVVRDQTKLMLEVLESSDV